ncbi:hypothetical protein CDD83_867 [Cordyceps sp. RAO-2017]|nr:hypothetical protein CDD83_867 [Cordyceps sp. RAO-2017]
MVTSMLPHSSKPTPDGGAWRQPRRGEEQQEYELVKRRRRCGEERDDDQNPISPDFSSPAILASPFPQIRHLGFIIVQALLFPSRNRFSPLAPAALPVVVPSSQDDSGRPQPVDEHGDVALKPWSGTQAPSGCPAVAVTALRARPNLPAGFVGQLGGHAGTGPPTEAWQPPLRLPGPGHRRCMPCDGALRCPALAVRLVVVKTRIDARRLRSMVAPRPTPPMQRGLEPLRLGPSPWRSRGARRRGPARTSSACPLLSAFVPFLSRTSTGCNNQPSGGANKLITSSHRLLPT